MSRTGPLAIHLRSRGVSLIIQKAPVAVLLFYGRGKCPGRMARSMRRGATRQLTFWRAWHGGGVSVGGDEMGS